MRAAYRRIRRHENHLLKTVSIIIGVIAFIGICTAIFVNRESLPIPFLNKPFSAETFAKIATEAGLSVKEQNNSYAPGSGVIASIRYVNDNEALSYELYIFDTDEIADNQFNSLIGQIENGGRRDLVSRSIKYNDDRSYYIAEAHDGYYTIYRSKNSMFYGTSTPDNKEHLQEYTKKLIKSVDIMFREQPLLSEQE